MRLIVSTRQNEYILRGASPRATLSVTEVSKSVAQLRGRDYVTPRDVQEVFLKTIPHRLILSPKARHGGLDVEKILGQILERIPKPEMK